MEKISVVILDSGTEARELNPFGDEPNHLAYKDENQFGEMVFATESKKFRYAEDWDVWQKVEASLRTFEIDRPNVEFLKLLAGTIHTAEILEDGKIKILS